MLGASQGLGKALCRQPQQRQHRPCLKVKQNLVFRGSIDTVHGGSLRWCCSGQAGQAAWRRWHPTGQSHGISLCVFHAQEPSQQQAVLGTAFLTLAVFVVLYVLVYVECLVRRWLRASALLIWACLVTLGYVLVFDSWMNEACAWEQVRGRGPWHPRGLDAASWPYLLWASGPSGGWPSVWCVGPRPLPLLWPWFCDLGRVLGRPCPVSSLSRWGGTEVGGESGFSGWTLSGAEMASVLSTSLLTPAQREPFLNQVESHWPGLGHGPSLGWSLLPRGGNF